MLLPSAGFGGTERHSAALAAALQRAGVTTTIAAESAVLEGLRATTEAAAAGRLVAAPLGAQDRARQYEVALRLIDDIAPDVALAPLPWPDAGLGVQHALLDKQTPAVFIAHLAPAYGSLEGAGAFPPRDWGASSAVWAAVSAPTAQRIEAMFGLPAGRVVAIRNAIPPPMLSGEAPGRAALRARLGLKPQARIALVAGRLDAVKGVDLTAEIARRLADDHVTLVLAGEGPLRPQIEAELKTARAPLRLVGFRPDILAWMAAADVLFLPSRREGWPLVFLEAAWLRRPVVASHAALECLGGEADAYATLAEALTPAALAEALRQAFTQRQATEAKVANAYRLVCDFPHEMMSARYIGLMRAAIGLQRHRAAGRGLCV